MNYLDVTITIILPIYQSEVYIKVKFDRLLSFRLHICISLVRYISKNIFENLRLSPCNRPVTILTF